MTNDTKPVVDLVALELFGVLVWSDAFFTRDMVIILRSLIDVADDTMVSAIFTIGFH